MVAAFERRSVVGVLSLMLGIFGVCICWLPGAGWLGVASAAVACGLGVPSITHWFDRPGYTGWGAAGILLGEIAVAVGFAYQAKHAAGALDFLYHALPVHLGCAAASAAFAVTVAGLLVARLRSRPIGITIAAFSIAVSVVFASWSLISADRALDRSAETDSRIAP